MLIRNESINHYLKWMVDGWCFSFAGFSDAEWYCILEEKIGNTTALGQVLDAEHGKLLLDVLQRRQGDERFLFAIPSVLSTMPGFAEGQIDWLLGRHNIKIVGYERDRVTDNLARDGRMYPFIRQLQDMNLIMIGPEFLQGMEKHLRYKHFVEIDTPNLHMDPYGIDCAVERALECRGKVNTPCVYLVSAGVSAAVIIDRLHDKVQPAWLYDCGSIWDGFVGAGGQRQWRADLYQNPKLWARWKKDNLDGKHSR